jgi:hypothetical protein
MHYQPQLSGLACLASQRISSRAHLIARQDDVSGGLLARLLGAIGPRGPRRLQGAGVGVDLLELPFAAVEGGDTEVGGEACDLLLSIAAGRKTPLVFQRIQFRTGQELMSKQLPGAAVEGGHLQRRGKGA